MASHDDDTARSLLNRWGTTVSLIRYCATQIGMDEMGVGSSSPLSHANSCGCGKHGISKGGVPHYYLPNYIALFNAVDPSWAPERPMVNPYPWIVSFPKLSPCGSCAR